MLTILVGFDQLQQNWNYLNIWWNSADFALILACLLVDEAPASICYDIWKRLAALRKFELTRPSAKWCGRSYRGGGFAFGGSILITFATGGLAAPLMAPISAASFGLMFGSGIVAGAINVGEDLAYSFLNMWIGLIIV